MGERTEEMAVCQITAIPFCGPTAGLATLCGVKRCEQAGERPGKMPPDAGKWPNLEILNNCDIMTSRVASMPGTPRHHPHARRTKAKTNCQINGKSIISAVPNLLVANSVAI